MSKNNIVINGKKAELTEEQLKALGIETRKNPFERVNPDVDDKYYYIRVSGDVADYRDVNDNGDRLLYEASNYFNDESFANQVALHQLLYRKLLKFSYDNECEDILDWDGDNPHYYIYYHIDDSEFAIERNSERHLFGAYFGTAECASRAIKEVVEPFMKEHPDFVW